MDSLEKVTAAILCGGLGTRLRSVLPNTPKVLAEIRGKPFLTNLLDQLNSGGFKKVVLCTGFLGDQIASKFGDSYGNLQLLYSQETEQLGTAGALRLALPELDSEYILAMNGDSYINVDLEAFWMWFNLCEKSAAIMITAVPDTGRYGRIEVDAKGAIRGFVEKGKTMGAGWINAGVYLLEKKFILSIPADRAVSLENEMFPAWLQRGIYGYMTGAEFIDIGTPESYEVAEQIMWPKRDCEKAPLCCM